MKVRRIDLNDEELPERISVDMSAEEALYLAALLGKQTGITANEVMPGGAVLSSECYGALTGGLFNRFYDDGVQEALRESAES